MNVILHPRAAPSDRARIWIGAFDATAAPPLRWFLDSVETVPIALRPLNSVRGHTMFPAGTDLAVTPRAFAGVYEFHGLQPGTKYNIAVHAGGTGATLDVRTLPASVPRLLEDSFNVLLVSCFHRDEDPAGLAGTIVSQLPTHARPHLSLLMGDQVYLDLPTLRNFADNEAWLAEKFERDYATNWRDKPGYAEILDAAPSVSLPDDHEYWNNYPHPSPMVDNSLSAAGRGRWRRPAIAMYEGFQLPYPATIEQPLVLDVSPLSFFFPDMRSARDEGRVWSMHPHGLARMRQWVDDVIARRDFAVFVSGQSLLSPAMGSFGGAVQDYELPNYRDYGDVMRQLARLADAGLPALCLTGDVHWGRVTETRDVRTNHTAIYEIISSPSSLVTTVGADQISAVGAWFSRLFGSPIAWPRHSDPDPPPDFLASDVLAERFRCTMLHGQRGNHVALLRFARSGGALQFSVTYWPITRDSALGRPVGVGPFQLRRT
ncbi:MAG: hypothetical protein KFF77_07060 [Bacteroidetes bacterium]|nr:hypothetical protein [Bacteroidota bacterium]